MNRLRNLTIPELYNLTILERRFVQLYNKWNFVSSTNPLTLFRRLKNPNNLDLFKELELVDKHLDKNYVPGYKWKPDSWVAWLQKWINNSYRAKEEPKNDLNLPFYRVMEKYYASLNYKHKEEYKKHHDYIIEKLFFDVMESGTTYAEQGYPENKYWIEKYVLNYACIVNGRDLYDLVDERMLHLIHDQQFDDEGFLTWLAVRSPGLLGLAMDLKYGPSFDKVKDDGSVDFSLRRNKEAK